MNARLLFLGSAVALAGALVFKPDIIDNNKEKTSARSAPRVIKASDHGVGRLVPDLAFTDLNGKKGRLSDFQKARSLVIVLTSTTCPLNKKYAPSLARFEKEMSAQGVAFLYVNPDSGDQPKDIRAAIKQYGFKAPYVHDKSGSLAKALGALTTTDTFLLDSRRTLAYRGALDDQYGIGYATNAPQQTYLRDALRATLTGEPVRVPATWAPGCALDLSKAKSPAPVAVTYHNRISRIFQNNCMECHRKGGVAPFALETYQQVASKKGAIRFSVEEGLMPPWFAAKVPHGESNPWANDRSLSDKDKEDLLQWIANGMPEGNSKDAPKPLKFSQDWEIGKPDTVFQLPEPIQVKAEGIMAYQHVLVETNFKEDKWIQKLEVQPTARQVVHHVLVFVVPKAKPGERTFDLLRHASDESQGFFAAYVPGNNTLIYPEGFAKFVPAGSRLLFQIHYTPNGTAVKDQTRLGLVFAKKMPKHVVRSVGIMNFFLNIPPNTDNHPESATQAVPMNTIVTAFMPHMHVRGKAFRFELVTPDGERRTLLDVPNYDFNWQLQYRLAEPLEVPKGSRIVATGWYNNTANNPANPDPNRRVRFGLQTYDEMMLGYVEYYLPDEKPSQMLSPYENALGDSR